MYPFNIEKRLCQEILWSKEFDKGGAYFVRGESLIVMTDAPSLN